MGLASVTVRNSTRYGCRSSVWPGRVAQHDVAEADVLSPSGADQLTLIERDPLVAAGDADDLVEVAGPALSARFAAPVTIAAHGAASSRLPLG